MTAMVRVDQLIIRAGLITIRPGPESAEYSIHAGTRMTVEGVPTTVADVADSVLGGIIRWAEVTSDPARYDRLVSVDFRPTNNEGVR